MSVGNSDDWLMNVFEGGNNEGAGCLISGIIAIIILLILTGIIR